MHILVVGAGSIGRLYGHCLQRGKATVDVYVKPKYVERAREGYILYNRTRGLDSPERFEPESVYSSPEQIESVDHDAVLLCIPSTGLRGDWFDDFAAAVGDATVVSLTPALEDRQFVVKRIGEAQFAAGLITSVAYPAPMEGESAPEPGTAYWMPPMVPAYFQGADRRLAPVMGALERGGMKARRIDNLALRAGFGSAVLMAFVASLEAKDWSIPALRRDDAAMDRLVEAADEAMGAVELYLGETRPLPARLLSKTTLKGALMTAPKVPPFDLETYLETHFTKVGAQNRLMVEEYIERRREDGRDSPALEALLDAIGPFGE